MPAARPRPNSATIDRKRHVALPAAVRAGEPAPRDIGAVIYILSAPVATTEAVSGLEASVSWLPMLRLGTTITPFDGPVEAAGGEPSAEGWTRGGTLGDALNIAPGSIVAVVLPSPTTDDPITEFESLMNGVDGEGTLAILTGTDGFGTLGDLALLEPDRPFVPILDWASVGGVPASLERCRAVLQFAQEHFTIEQVSPFRTRVEATRLPDLSGLSLASQMLGMDVVLILDGLMPPSGEVGVTGRRLGSGPVDLTPVTVFADGDRWVPQAMSHTVRLSNIDKPFFPDGTTKGDVIEFYAGVAEVLLPHLEGRPISMSRYPDGIDGPSFYEKRAPGHQPEWMRTGTVDSESMGGEIDFLLAEDRPSLMWFANMGCIEVHPFHSRVADLDHPDYAIFDLDPAAGSQWDQVVTATSMVKTMLDALGLDGYPKLSGSTGMHVYVPLARGAHDYARVRRFVAAVGDLMAKANPADITVDWKIPNRAGKVFVDANRNASGQTIASVYSVRPRPGAPVSAPIDWDEVAELHNGDITIRNIGRRLSEKGDVFAPVLRSSQRLDAAEEALGL